MESTPIHVRIYTISVESTTLLFWREKPVLLKINGVKLTKQNLVYRLLTIPTEHGIVGNRCETKAQN